MTAVLEPTQELPTIESEADVNTFPKPPTAPYGLKADGTPRGKPGPAKGAPARGGRRTTGDQAAAPPRRPTPNKPSPKASEPINYAQGIVELVSVPIGVLAGAGMLRKDAAGDALLADASVLNMLAPAVGDAAAKFAAANPNHQAVKYLDKLLTVGPYAVFGAALATAVVQIAVNHGMIPAGVMGTKSPKLLALQMRMSMQAAAAQQAAAHADEQALLDLIAEQQAA